MCSGTTVIVGSQRIVLYRLDMLYEYSQATYKNARASAARVRVAATRTSEFERCLVRRVKVAIIRLPVPRPCLMSTRRYVDNLILVPRALVSHTRYLRLHLYYRLPICTRCCWRGTRTCSTRGLVAMINARGREMQISLKVLNI